MDRSSWLVAAGLLVVVVAYAVLATLWVSSEPGWYARLDKPAFQPPDVVFGVIWPLNFLALGVVGVLLSRSEPTRTALGLLVLLAVSAGFAVAWAYLFYVPHLLLPAALCLLVAVVLTWALVALAWQANPAYGLALVVYAGWLTVATALAFAYARTN